jgi:hypothetical protein
MIIYFDYLFYLIISIFKIKIKTYNILFSYYYDNNNKSYKEILFFNTSKRKTKIEALNFLKKHIKNQ